MPYKRLFQSVLLLKINLKDVQKCKYFKNSNCAACANSRKKVLHTAKNNIIEIIDNRDTLFKSANKNTRDMSLVKLCTDFGRKGPIFFI